MRPVTSAFTSIAAVRRRTAPWLRSMSGTPGVPCRPSALAWASVTVAPSISAPPVKVLLPASVMPLPFAPMTVKWPGVAPASAITAS
ncbi:MAG: hypothetical protein BWX70_03191 [Verrucomicrobia bacterium ADurb.Bin070]|nr:MAG: hypothetical protein BWX70_03191 [Verrucomicrobia bacterium ADurb.Bin070]